MSEPTRLSVLPRRPAFTLVELLVVIGIIALLIAILLPSLMRARQSAESTTCLSNIRQAGIGIYMYSDTYKGWLPPSATFWGHPTWADNILDFIRAKSRSFSPGNEWSQSLYGKAFVCPAAQQDGYNHYSTHPRLLPNTGRTDHDGTPLKPYKRSSIPRTSELVMLFDGVQILWPGSGEDYGNAEHDAYQLNSSSIFWNRFTQPTGWGPDAPVRTYGYNQDALTSGDPWRGQVRWRHNKNLSANFLFVDGHADAFRHSGGPSTFFAGDAMDAGEFKQRNVMLIDNY